MATNRPSLLDDADLAPVASKKAKERTGPGRDNAKMLKIGAALVLFALAIVAATFPMWRPEGPARDGQGRVIEPRVMTPEDEEAFQRQQRELELFLEQGGQEGSE